MIMPTLLDSNCHKVLLYDNQVDTSDKWRLNIHIAITEDTTAASELDTYLSLNIYIKMSPKRVTSDKSR